MELIMIIKKNKSRGANNETKFNKGSFYFDLLCHIFYGLHL